MTNPEERLTPEGWPEPRQYRKSVRTEFSLLVAGMMTLLMLAFGYSITSRYVSTVSHYVVRSLLIQARSFSTTAGNHIIAASGSDKLMLNSICQKLAADNPELYWAGIADRDGLLLAHTDLRQVMAGTALPARRNRIESDLLLPGEAMTIENDTLYIFIPIVEDDISLGHMGIASSTRAIQEARSTSVFTVVAITLVIMLLGIPITIVRLRGKLRPITDIAQAVREADVGRLTESVSYRGENEIGYLAETLRVMGSKLHAAQQELIEKERLAQEMQIAHDIQASILPRAYPQSTRFSFAGTYRSAREVGGDYYDFIEFDDRHLAFIIADVSGKSIPGMIVMLLTRDIVKRLAHTVRQPAELLSAVNHELFMNIREGMFVTMLYGLLHKDTGRCVFASAGHNSVIRVDGATGKSTLIKTKGFPLGLVGPAVFDDRIESGELSLQPGDWIVLYTDGINEAQNEQGELFGLDRLRQLLESRRAGDPDALIVEFLQQHEAFVGSAPQYDDITLLSLKWHGDRTSAPAPIAPEVTRAGG